MEKEIEAAVEWWAEQLAGPVVHDNGDIGQSLFATGLAAGLPTLKAVQIETFKSELRKNLKAHIEAVAWKPEDPTFGAYGRSLGVDYHPDRLLADAAEAAGIGAPMLRFPCKTMMWVNPGQVEVAKGYGARPVTIYRAEQV